MTIHVTCYVLKVNIIGEVILELVISHIDKGALIVRISIFMISNKYYLCPEKNAILGAFYVKVFKV